MLKEGDGEDEEAEAEAAALRVVKERVDGAAGIGCEPIAGIEVGGEPNEKVLEELAAAPGVLLEANAEPLVEPKAAVEVCPNPGVAG